MLSPTYSISGKSCLDDGAGDFIGCRKLYFSALFSGSV